MKNSWLLVIGGKTIAIEMEHKDTDKLEAQQHQQEEPNEEESEEWSTADADVVGVPGPAWMPGGSRYKEPMDWDSPYPAERVAPINKGDVAQIRWEDTKFIGSRAPSKREQQREPFWKETRLDPDYKQEEGEIKCTPPIELCRVCLGHGTQLCSVCKSARYCGQKCQAKDWPEHRKAHAK